MAGNSDRKGRKRETTVTAEGRAEEKPNYAANNDTGDNTNPANTDKRNTSPA